MKRITNRAIDVGIYTGDVVKQPITCDKVLLEMVYKAMFAYNRGVDKTATSNAGNMHRTKPGLSSESKSRAAKGAARSRAKAGEVEANSKKRALAANTKAAKKPEVRYVAEVD